MNEGTTNLHKSYFMEILHVRRYLLFCLRIFIYGNYYFADPHSESLFAIFHAYIQIYDIFDV